MLPLVHCLIAIIWENVSFPIKKKTLKVTLSSNLPGVWIASGLKLYTFWIFPTFYHKQLLMSFQKLTLGSLCFTTVEHKTSGLPSQILCRWKYFYMFSDILNRWRTLESQHVICCSALNCPDGIKEKQSCDVWHRWNYFVIEQLLLMSIHYKTQWVKYRRKVHLHRPKLFMK